MSGEKLRLASISVLGGSLHGRRRDLEEVVAEVLVGSDPDCHLVVDLPSVSPIHARLWTDLDQAEVRDTRAPRGLYVNTERVEGQAILRPGDVLWLGPPQDPGSVCIQCRFEPWVEVLPGAGQEEPEAPAAAGAPVDAFDLDATESASQAVEIAGEASDEYEAVVFEGEEAEGGPVAAVPVDAGEDLVLAAAAGEPPVEAPTAEPSEPPATAAAEGLFVGGAEPVPAAEAAPVPAAEEETSFVFEDEAPEPAAAAPAAAGPDEWSIEEPGPAAEEAPVPSEETGADDFFVTETPEAAEAPAAPVAEAAPSPFAGFETFEEGPAAPPLVPAWEAPPAPPALAPPAAPAPPTPQAPAVPVVAPREAAPSPAPPQAPVAPAAAPPSPAAGSATPAKPPVPAAKPEPGVRPRPVSSIPKRPPAGAPARKAGTPAAARPGRPTWLRPAGLGLAGVLVLGALGGGAWALLGRGVRVVSIEPARARVGQRATIAGRGFSSTAAENSVVFEDRPARVLASRPDRLDVEVPELAMASGGERQVPVVVRVGSRAAAPWPVTVIQGPRLHGLSPEAALPGEEVQLVGAGWGLGATVRFGTTPGQVVAVDATSLRAIVPQDVGPVGTRAPVVVTVAGVDSNPAPFVVGRLPVLSEVVPASAAPGDTIQITGLGFQARAADNDVRIAGVPALVLASSGDGLKVVVPRLPAGESSRVVEVRVPGSESVGQGALQSAGMPEVVELRFVPEPFSGVGGRAHAVVATGLGPAFAFADSGGQTAAERAFDAARKLDGVAGALRTTLGLTFEARGYDTSPTLGLAGQPDTLLTVTEEDAAAYNEDWTGLKGKGGPVTRGRLLRWWEAVAKDLVLATVRGERPHFAADLAPEGRALQQVFDAARRPGQQGLAQAAVVDAKPPLRDALRLVGFRVPEKVTAPAAPAVPGAPAAPAASAPAPARLPQDATLRGSENEESQGLRYLTVELRGAGSISYEGGLTLTLPLTSLEKGRDRLRFSVPIRGAMRYYTGRWDGEKVTGTISTDSAGRNVVGSFELRVR